MNIIKELENKGYMVCNQFDGYFGTEEEIREYAMYGCPDVDMQFLF